MSAKLKDMYLPADILTGSDNGVSLSAILDFDHVVSIQPMDASNPANANAFHIGTPGGIYAPDVLDPESGSTAIEGYPEWELITAGLTGQYSYSGPWLHDSEIIEGGVAGRILEHAHETGGGYYVAIYAQHTPEIEQCESPDPHYSHSLDCNCETVIEGWAIAYRPFTNTTTEEV